MHNTPTTLVFGESSAGTYGVFKIEVFVNTEPGHKLTDEESMALYEAKDLIEAAFMKVRIRRDPKYAEEAAHERSHLLGLFPEPIFVEELPNGYCNRWCCAHRPWFKVTTKKGRIEIGRRKSVISISWDECVTGGAGATALFPDENVTKDGCLIHAWSLADAKRYIETLLK